MRYLVPLAILAGCYKPAPPSGALLCSTEGSCPDGYHCALDQTCWRDGADPSSPSPDAALFTEPLRAISPRNGTATGSVRAVRSRRPVFRWRPVAEATSYELEVDDSCDPAAFRACAFPSPEARETATGAFVRISDGLAIASTAPVGRRYYWRVRGCGAAALCTPWSEVRYLDVGRVATDYTGDGDSDLAIGNANTMINSLAGAGAVYLADGAAGTGPGVFRGITAPTPEFGEHFGITVASAGDLDADGVAELAVGAETSDPGGRVYVYRAAAFQTAGAPLQILANPTPLGQHFGQTIVGGDLNGDGLGDLLVGAEYNGPADAYGQGQVFGYAGDGSPTALPATPTWTLDNPTRQEQGRFGSVLALGDFDGDGYADVAVGAVQQDAIGRVFVYRGGAAGLATTPATTLDDPNVVTNAYFGGALAAGDFDGDGYADLAVGAFNEASGAQAALGRVYVFHGGPAGIADKSAPRRVLDPPTPASNALFGVQLTAGDFNADDTDDLAVASGFDQQTGRVYVYQADAAGVPAVPTTVLIDPSPAAANDFFGFRLAVGDRAPSDGTLDLFVGAARDRGTVYLFSGSSTGLPTATTTTLTGASLPDGDLGPSSLSSAPP